MNIFVLVPDIYKKTLDASFIRSILKNDNDTWISNRTFFRVEYHGYLLPLGELRSMLTPSARIPKDEEILIFTFTPEPTYNRFVEYIGSLTSIVHYMLGYFDTPPVIINLGSPNYINESERVVNLEVKGNDQNE